ncbi:unnamed protein product [Didymodactylos carnosus]|uniref:Glyoxylate reductase/hydroxypyruvate reductase n=1 Tax=Didymodactylos carnosus TaxID=1234261 RepID=A0A814UAL0_9BILA|nr:unnamed protein product [Didymodactylos carnosus]CAF1169548.1 unnamed protein product [Didymodactylos carnosus]CAF3816388.1 unnamed protein product [Didymodactylos carnosus]CAF3933268.1 unnamed protein product [Didymodactylos carnosus]
MSRLPRLLIPQQLPTHFLRILREKFECDYHDNSQPMQRDELLKQVEKNSPNAILFTLTTQVDKEILDRCGTNLKALATISVGYDHVDIAECKKRNIPVGYTPGVLTDSTADLTIGLLIATARRFEESIQSVRHGQWGLWQLMNMCGKSITDSTVGIVGLGRIGMAVARRLIPFGVKEILYTGNSEKTFKEEADKRLFSYVKFFDLLSQSDFVIITCALNEKTKNLFDIEAFKAMKSDSILINTSRGPVVDQDALYEALSNGQIQAAGLDVTVPEPLPPTHKLLTLKNCLILPHIGSADVTTRMKMAQISVDNLCNYFEDSFTFHEKKTHGVFKYVNGHCFDVGYRYSDLKYLGDGAFGKVASAYDNVTGENVAIKKIQLPYANRLYWTRTIRELCILHAIKHDNVVRLLDCFTNANCAENIEEVYFVFNLMDMDLHEIIRKHRNEGDTLTSEHVQFLMYQLVRGLKFIHSANIMHRDLKPSNIFVTKECDLRLGDFGLARIPEADGGQMTEYVTTRWYRAPELMLASGYYDKSADIWSAGCIFGELLRGQPLFPGTHYANQLDLIFDCIGYPKDPQQDLQWLPEKAKNYVVKRYQKCKTSLTETFSFKNSASSINKLTTMESLALDLLEKMLQFSPSKRITAATAISRIYQN